MENDTLNQRFIDAIKERIPQRGELTKTLSDLLFIEKEAVYRRLRGEVPFTFMEVAKTAIRFGFSLDSIAEASSPISRPLNMRMIKFLDPDEDDYIMLESFARSVYVSKTDPTFESGSIVSIIPSALCVLRKYIYKFYLFKWLCQFGEKREIKSFAETMPSDRLNELNRIFVKGVQESPSSIYIFDEHFLEYLLNDIKYFYHIHLLTKNDVDLILEDTASFLDELRRYADKGRFDAGGKVSIYISNIHFETSYNYIESKNYKMTMIRAFTLSDAYSLDEDIFYNMKKWTNFLKRTSTLISESGEIERINFFEKQQEMLNLF